MLGKRSLVSLGLALALTLTVGGPSAALPEGAPEVSMEASAPSAPQDVPHALVTDGVTSYDLAAPKLFWYTWSGCTPSSTAMSDAANGDQETIKRIATYGSQTRTVWENEVASPECQDDVLSSNIVADDDHVYWVSRAYGGVVQLPTDANPGDAPTLLSDAVSGYSELAQDSNNVYALSKTGGGIWRISKSSGARERVTSDPGTSPHDLQADGKYVYWITAGALKRVVRTGRLKVVTTLATGVTGYYPEGRRISYCVIGSGCVYVEYVFVAQGSQVVRYDNVSGSMSTPFYTSTDTSASVHTLVSVPSALLQGYLFLIESREVSCDFFCTYENVLVRTGRGGGAVDVLHTTGTGTATVQRIAEHLEAEADYIFWQEEGGLKRLPHDAAALAMTNMRITGLEITQSVQDLDNSVRLIEDRRTFVRVYVASDGDAVPGVTMYLYKTSESGTGTVVAGPLVPVNSVGQHITVHPPSAFYRLGLNRSFLFELPWDWTTGTLHLRAVLNPHRAPPQASYVNNTWEAGPFAFVVSPRLQVQFVSFGYDLDGQTYYPHLIDDVFQTYSWIRRTYPLASTPGGASDPSPGFRPNLWVTFVEWLGTVVDQSNPACALLYSNPDRRNLCASKITNMLMKQMRVENGVPGNVFMYGMISDAAGYFPRGQASGTGNVSSGPTGSGTWGWDTDGSYGDWYAGHEIGHTLSRSHPYKGSQQDTAVCGQGPNDGSLDGSYPYQDGRLSSIPATMWGFDVGDGAFNLPIQLYPGALWFDVMTYCGFLWLSDYTYDGMYNYMVAHPSSDLESASLASARVSGDFLGVYGSISGDEQRAVIHSLRRVGSVATVPPLVPSDDNYRIRLLNGNGGVLADHGFTPEADENAVSLSFGQVVTFEPGTAQVQIIKGNSDQVLASETVSAHPPTVSSVALEGASSVVTGTVTLSWTASDDDGDALSFDVQYSTDGGATFLPVQMGAGGGSSSSSHARIEEVAGSVEVDTTSLSGSDSAILRVVASDGVHTAQGETDPFVMADKPPLPRILSPADGVQVHYGQLLNFSGEALDAQDGSVADGSLAWSTQDGPLGTGALLSVDDLPVGVNEVTLTAENSEGLSASTSITVIVDDDLGLPGPTLSVAPMQIGWHVAAGTTAAQSVQVDISNAGSGTLDWVAEEDADWVTLDATSGAAPSTLGVTADPVGVADGLLLSTTLRIVAPAATDHVTETVEIPVSLLVGDTYHLISGGPWQRVYLPAVLRSAGP